MEGRLLKAVQGLYKDSEATVKVGKEMTDWFEVQRGGVSHVSLAV